MVRKDAWAIDVVTGSVPVKTITMLTRDRPIHVTPSYPLCVVTFASSREENTAHNAPSKTTYVIDFRELGTMAVVPLYVQNGDCPLCSCGECGHLHPMPIMRDHIILRPDGDGLAYDGIACRWHPNSAPRGPDHELFTKVLSRPFEVYFVTSREGRTREI